jgi:hypothetical protein
METLYVILEILFIYGLLQVILRSIDECRKFDDDLLVSVYELNFTLMKNGQIQNLPINFFTSLTRQVFVYLYIYIYIEQVGHNKPS